MAQYWSLKDTVLVNSRFATYEIDPGEVARLAELLWGRVRITRPTISFGP